ncbi:hypothetical protein MA16_Dca004072 [Dendrobium catenatum]|uniref:Uncharacterized protein n=1 Tax=Dendrobium catenatum TaxID=906689 RepID=A0A2I0X2C1_9ASPA|nr:hypothetical protein MA16_Dca004072 [Dendrobium catenatum]
MMIEFIIMEGLMGGPAVKFGEGYGIGWEDGRSLGRRLELEVVELGEDLDGCSCPKRTHHQQILKLFDLQIRRSLLNEDESGFRRAKRPIYYYDDGLEKTRQTLNAKISQLNSAIDNVSSRLRGGKNTAATELIETEPEVEATL